MTSDDFTKLQKQVSDLQYKLDFFVKPDRYLFQRNIELFPGKKLIGGIYAGSDANPPQGWSVSVGSGGSAGQNTVTHNLGTDKLSIHVTVIGSANEVFEVGVEIVSDSVFKVYTAAGGSLVSRSFHFLVART